jgi:hypothetical protein
MWTEAWPSRALTNLERSLNELRAAVDRPDRSWSVDVTGHLTRFLVVRSCGYLEQVVDECCRAYLKSKAAPGAAAFGSSWLGGGRNPTPGMLESLVARFGLGLEAELHELFASDDEYLKREIGLLVDRRNKIAHGLNENIGSRKALDLVNAATTTADWFLLRLDPRS